MGENVSDSVVEPIGIEPTTSGLQSRTISKCEGGSSIQTVSAEMENLLKSGQDHTPIHSKLNLAWVGPGSPRLHYQDSYKLGGFASIHLWTEESDTVYHAIEDHRWAREAYRAKHWPAVNDVVRLAILYEVGGWYCDATDVEWLKPPFEQSWFRPDAVIACWESIDWLNNGVLFAPRRSPWIKSLLDRYADKPFDPDTLVDNTGPCMLTKEWWYYPRGVLTLESDILQAKMPTSLDYFVTSRTCARHHFYQTRKEPELPGGNA